MAPNVRRFSQITDDLSETSFANSRSNTGSTQDHTHEPKRRRTSGLNARFDNMVHAMNATYSGSRNLRQRQIRARSSSDASHLSSVISEAYSDLHEGRIGDNFTLIRMQPLVDSHRFTDAVQENEIPNSKSKNRTENAPSVHKALPEWLCSTFSTLAAKHPLRLLLPKKSPCPQTGTNDQNSSDDSETNPTFALNPDRMTQTMHIDQAVNLVVSGSTSDRDHSSTSFTAKSNTQQYRSPSAAYGDYVSHTLDVGPSLMSGPNIVPVHQHLMTSKTNEVNQQDPHIASEYEDLAFIPFSTPGPASALQSSMVIGPFPPRLNLYAQNCLVDMNTETSARSPSPCHVTSFMLPTSPSYPISESRQTSDDSSAIDYRLPPYHAAPSDPAPAYSSDDIYDAAYCTDPLKDEFGPESPGILNDKLTSVFATPGPRHCVPRLRPIYFDSPTEEPSDPDYSKPGYEIDFDTIDFTWTPFNRKSTEEMKLVPGYEHRPEPCRSSISQCGDRSESGVNCAAISTKPSKSGLPDSLPSPSPFRFTAHQLTTNTTLERETSSQAEPVALHPIKLAHPFAPAPGIFVSPLREKPETQTVAPKTPQNQSTHTEMDFNVKTEFPDSQGSHDSIQSWRDTDENCPSQN
ncbi:hypothetical protein E4T56_gene20103 [Termitomyces sp. T112]|nr:hypothetical protein E4T56_gene20103 [Termitomyces sp. T112]